MNTTLNYDQLRALLSEMDSDFSPLEHAFTAIQQGCPNHFVYNPPSDYSHRKSVVHCFPIRIRLAS